MQSATGQRPIAGVRTARRDGAGITKAVSCQERCDIGHNIRRGLWLAARPSISAPGSCRNDLFDHLVGAGESGLGPLFVERQKRAETQA